MPAPRLGEASRWPGRLPGGGKIDSVEMLLDRRLDARHEEHRSLFFVAADDPVDSPGAAGHLLEPAVTLDEQVAVAIALARPEEPAVVEDTEVAGEVDPRFWISSWIQIYLVLTSSMFPVIPSYQKHVLVQSTRCFQYQMHRF